MAFAICAPPAPTTASRLCCNLHHQIGKRQRRQQTVDRIQELLPADQALDSCCGYRHCGNGGPNVDHSRDFGRYATDYSVFSTILVMGVVLAFFGRTIPIVATGVTIPLAFAGTFTGMWVAGISIDNLSLMALGISVGFVVDDAIVVIETVMRRIERGDAPLQAAIADAGRVAFTVSTISLSIAAAFLPLMFAGGVLGKYLHTVCAHRHVCRARLDHRCAHGDADAVLPATWRRGSDGSRGPSLIDRASGRVDQGIHGLAPPHAAPYLGSSPGICGDSHFDR